MKKDETTLILRLEQALFDVTDKSLYVFDERNGLSKFREAATIVAIDNFLHLQTQMLPNSLFTWANKSHIFKTCSMP